MVACSTPKCTPGILATTYSTGNQNSAAPMYQTDTYR